MIDSFYTPKILSDRLVNLIIKDNVNTVADFCVGDGELLRSASEKWPKAKCYGSDISEDAINYAKKKHSKWNLNVLDFLDESSRKKSKLFKNNRVFDLILLNPPFSCVGSTFYEVSYNGQNYFVSTAMKFIVEALKYLSPNGVIYAILPASVAYSQKDKKLWNILEHTMNLSVIEESSVNYFKGCSPSIILVSINDFRNTSVLKNITRISLDIPNIEVFRGKLSMNLIPAHKTGNWLIHTTNLQNNKLSNLSIKITNSLSEVKGPAILLPRVGIPKTSKICLIKEKDVYVLSDCIIAIKLNSMKDANSLFRYLLNNPELLNGLYKGTGAKYVTVERMQQFLNLDIGFQVQDSKAV